MYSSDAACGVYNGSDVNGGGAIGYSDALFTIDSSTTTTIGGETVGNVDFDGDGLMDMAVAGASLVLGRLRWFGECRKWWKYRSC